MELLHSTHLSDCSMMGNARRLWWWLGMNNMINMYYQNCVKCQKQTAAKPRQQPVLPDDLTKMGPMEFCGVDLFELGGKHYLVMCDKRSGYRFCAFLNKTDTSDITAALEKCFFSFGIPSRLCTDGGHSSGRRLGGGVRS